MAIILSPDRWNLSRKRRYAPKQRITMESIEEIIKESTSTGKGANLDIYDRYSHGAQEKISQGYDPLGSILERRLPKPPPLPRTRINTNIQTILDIYTPI